MPDISTPALPVTKAPSVRATKFQTPQANGFMGEQYPAFQHHFLDIAKAQAEAEIQPNAVGNDLGGETLSPVARRGGGIHRHIATWLAEVDNAVADAKVNLEKKIAIVHFDPGKASTAALVKATTDAGYLSTARK